MREGKKSLKKKGKLRRHYNERDEKKKKEISPMVKNGKANITKITAL